MEVKKEVKYWVWLVTGLDSILPGSGFNLIVSSERLPDVSSSRGFLIVSSSRLLLLSLTDFGHIGHNPTLELLMISLMKLKLVEQMIL